MADEKRDVPGGRRKPPTIDLKATEIVSGSVNPSEPTDTLKETRSSEEPPAAAAAAESVTEAPAAGPQTASPEPRAAAPASEALSAPRAAAADEKGWGFVAASAAGAGAMLVVLLVILGTGVLAPHDDGPRITQLESQVRALANRPQPGADVLADLTARLGVAEQAMQRLGALETRLGRAEQGGSRTAEIETRLAKAEKDVGRIAELEQRLARGDSTASAAAVVDAGLTERVAALEAAQRPLSDVGARLDAANATAREAKSRADAAFDAAQKNSASLASPAAKPGDVEALAARVAALEQAAKAAQERIAATAGADKAGRLAFVAVSLRAAVERGDPFAQELAAAKPLADAKLIGALEPFAAGGVPRSAALARELSQLAGPMMNAAGAPPRDGGFLDRLQANAEKLVRIRPVNEAPGDDVATVITRADVKAAHGDIAGALAEVKSLPAAVSAPAQGWIRKADAQVAALSAARSLADGAVRALAKP